MYQLARLPPLGNLFEGQDCRYTVVVQLIRSGRLVGRNDRSRWVLDRIRDGMSSSCHQRTRQRQDRHEPIPVAHGQTTHHCEHKQKVTSTVILHSYHAKKPDELSSVAAPLPPLSHLDYMASRSPPHLNTFAGCTAQPAHNICLQYLACIPIHLHDKPGLRLPPPAALLDWPSPLPTCLPDMSCDCPQTLPCVFKFQSGCMPLIYRRPIDKSTGSFLPWSHIHLTPTPSLGQHLPATSPPPPPALANTPSDRCLLQGFNEAPTPQEGELLQTHVSTCHLTPASTR